MRDLPVLHGYTLGDLDRLSRIAGRRVHISAISMAWDMRERHELAWSGIAEALVLAEERPPTSRLVVAGRQAIYRGVRDDYRHHGVERRDPLAGMHSAPAFASYWWWLHRGHETDHAGGIVDRAALAQIWPLLREIDRVSLAALAVHGTYQAAAAALGINYVAFKQRIILARRRFAIHWYRPGLPARPYGVDRRVSVGDVPARRVAQSNRPLGAVHRRHRAGVATDAVPEDITS